MFNFYQVGGCVRDLIMGVESKDIDYVAVPKSYVFTGHGVNHIFDLLVKHLKEKGYEIFLITPEMFTIRAKFPSDHLHKGMVADFVLARKELGYKEGTREPIVVVGTLLDDLERRDFTVNAIAKTDDGRYIDPYFGVGDIGKRRLRCTVSAEKSFNDDPLRILRAIRFAITKGFIMDRDIVDAISEFDYANKMKVVSNERIREELHKCFKVDSTLTLTFLYAYPRLFHYIMTQTGIWLKPTFEK